MVGGFRLWGVKGKSRDISGKGCQERKKNKKQKIWVSWNVPPLQNTGGKKKKRMINAHAILEKPCAMRGTCAEKSEKVLYISTPSNDLLSWQAVSADSWVASVKIRLFESPGLTNGHFLFKAYFAKEKGNLYRKTESRRHRPKMWL